MIRKAVLSKAARPVRPTHQIIAHTFGEPSTDVYRNMASIANRVTEAFAALVAPIDSPAMHAHLAAMQPDRITARLDWAGFVKAANATQTPLRHTVQSFGRLEVTPAEKQRPIRKDAADPDYRSLFTDIDARAVATAQQMAGNLIVQVTKQVRDFVRSATADALSGHMTVWQLATVLKTGIPLTPSDAAAVQRFGDRLVAEGMKGGASYAAATASAQAAVGRMAATKLASRAQNIARTEVVAASNRGRYVGWQAQIAAGWADQDSIKQWVAADDACDDCQALDGEQQPWDEPFSTGDDMPPDHPSCRCSAVLLPKSAATSALGSTPTTPDEPMDDADVLGTPDTGQSATVQSALAEVTDSSTASAAAAEFDGAAGEAAVPATLDPTSDEYKAKVLSLLQEAYGKAGTGDLGYDEVMGAQQKLSSGALKLHAGTSLDDVLHGKVDAGQAVYADTAPAVAPAATAGQAKAGLASFASDAGREDFRDTMSWLPSSKAELQTITDYSSGFSYSTSEALRRGSFAGQDPSVKQLADQIDQMMAKSVTQQAAVVYRGVTDEAFPAPLLAAIKNPAVDVVGRSISDAAFVSTSMNASVADGYEGDVSLAIHVPAGTHAVYIGEDSAFPQEHELLLDRGLRMVVTGRKVDRNGHVTLDVEVLPK